MDPESRCPKCGYAPLRCESPTEAGDFYYESEVECPECGFRGYELTKVVGYTDLEGNKVGDPNPEIVCDRCGASMGTPIDIGFDPSLHEMRCPCGGRWIHRPTEEGC